MMKVFLVDDEIAIRENLRNSFPWEEKGYQLVGEVGRGVDAQGQLALYSPDGYPDAVYGRDPAV